MYKMLYPDDEREFDTFEEAISDWVEWENESSTIIAEPLLDNKGQVKWHLSFDLSDPGYDDLAYLEGPISGWQVLGLRKNYPTRLVLSAQPIDEMEHRICLLRKEFVVMAKDIDAIQTEEHSPF